MRYLLAIILTAFTASASVLSVRVTDALSNPLTNIQCNLSLGAVSTNGTNLVVMAAVTNRTDTNGQTYYSNVIAGAYSLRIFYTPNFPATFNLLITTNSLTNAIIDATSVLTATQEPGSQAGYTIAQADGRFVVRTNATIYGLTVIGSVISTNLDAKYMASSGATVSNLTVLGTITYTNLTVGDIQFSNSVNGSTMDTNLVVNAQWLPVKMNGTNFFIPLYNSNQPPQWIDVVANGYGFGNGANAPQLTAIGTPPGLQLMAYDTTPDYAFGNVQLSHNIAVTNAIFPNFYIIPHIHFCPTATIATDSTNVQWELVWEWSNINGTPSLSGTNHVEIGMNGARASAGYHMIASFGNITNNAATLSSDFRFKLSRIAASARDISARVGVMYIDVHVPVGNKTLIGSRQEVVQ